MIKGKSPSIGMNSSGRFCRAFPGGLLLIVLLFIHSCKSGDECTPTTCEEGGKDCGWISDGCGGEILCGECTPPETCGGGGTENVCGFDDECIPTTCEEGGKDCEWISDGCDGEIWCGECTLPETCGGGGTENVCGRELYDETGWTDLSSFLADDSRIVYVSAHGDDEAALSVHERGYYLPDDEEIGPDPTQPEGEVTAYATVEAARSALRVNRRLDNYPDDPMFPEWMLFRRGDEIDMNESGLTQVEIGGRSDAERRVYASYGDLSLPRPVLVNGGRISAWGVRGGNNLVIASLAGVNGFSIMYGASNILIEDVAFRQTGTNAIQIDGVDNIVIRRSVISGNHSADSHVQGIFMSRVARVVIEECVFDMNGYKEDPFDPSTWTAGVSAEHESLQPGEGFQPRRTWFDRNLYLSSYTDLKVRGNIISRGGGGGSVQMRVGGLAERNLFLFNQSALSVGHSQATRSYLHDALIRSNLVLHDDHFLPPGGFGIGLILGVGDEETGVMQDNIVAHFHRLNNGGGLLGATGIGEYQENPAQRAFHVQVLDNVALSHYGRAFSVASTSADDGIISGRIGSNVVAVLSEGQVVSSGDETPADTVDFGNEISGGNSYFCEAADCFRRGGSSGDFSDWEAAGYDSHGAHYSMLEALAEDAGWATAMELNDPQGRNGWERDIVSYMMYVDPTYEPNEDVTVDDGVPQANRRPDAPMVWQVLSDSSLYPDSNFWSRRVLSEDEAKLAARRYHAFLVFIERAKANRRGAWKRDYTADAVNNYIRQGFGKATVQGEYTGEPDQ